MKENLVKGRSTLFVLLAILGTLSAQDTGAADNPSKEKPMSTLPRVRVITDLKLRLMPIMLGSFIMGTPASQNPTHDELQHKVTLTRQFWMGRTEVTQTQYETIMGSNPSVGKGADRPVDSVSWDNAVEFCRKLTERERKAGRLPDGLEYDLPTEAEWEYCARAGAKGKYHFGDDALQLTNYGWFYGNSGDAKLDGIDLSTWNHEKLLSNKCRSHPVGKKKPNSWGLYDMHGNVSEWCLDWQVDYERGPQTDPKGSSKGIFRVHRGGTWYGPADWCRSGRRNGISAKHKSDTMGFRVVLRSVQPIKEKEKANN